jgi:hypothetical protein
MRTVRTLAVVGLIAIAGWTPTCAAERVDLLLVLAADISRSVDEVKFQLFSVRDTRRLSPTHG